MLSESGCVGILDRITILDESIDHDYTTYAQQQVQQELTPPSQVLTRERITSDITALTDHSATDRTRSPPPSANAALNSRQLSRDDAAPIEYPPSPTSTQLQEEATSFSCSTGRGSVCSASTGLPSLVSDSTGTSYGHPVLRDFNTVDNSPSVTSASTRNTRREKSLYARDLLADTSADPSMRNKENHDYSQQPLLPPLPPSPELKFLTEVEVDYNGDTHVWTSEPGQVEETVSGSGSPNSPHNPHSPHSPHSPRNMRSAGYISAGGSQNGEGSDFPEFPVSDELSISSSVKSEQRRKRRMLIAILVMLIVIVLCSLLVTRNRRDKHEYTVNVGDNNGQQVTTLESSNANQNSNGNVGEGTEEQNEETEEEENPLVNTNEYKVLAPKVEDPSKLLDPYTPQGEAFEEIIAEEWGQTPKDEFRIVQRFSLTTLFKSTTEMNSEWDIDLGWQDGTEDECYWWGCLTCRRSKYGESSVTNLNLENNNLRGEFPSEICLLSEIEILNLSSNNFFGPIPSCIIEKLINLEVLDLRNNQFSGLQDGDDVTRDISKLCNRRSNLVVKADCNSELTCGCCECSVNS